MPIPTTPPHYKNTNYSNRLILIMLRDYKTNCDQNKKCYIYYRKKKGDEPTPNPIPPPPPTPPTPNPVIEPVDLPIPKTGRDINGNILAKGINDLNYTVMEVSDGEFPPGLISTGNNGTLKTSKKIQPQTFITVKVDFDTPEWEGKTLNTKAPMFSIGSKVKFLWLRINGQQFPNKTTSTFTYKNRNIMTFGLGNKSNNEATLSFMLI